ncbi:hypothetical protein HAX54_008541 [Datura stramonium]|uniref:Uncharacterized protein n=1 Tax=Datura stramonium TaxID=4076 RepID=A0ABS8TF95_DATST|nr:hypothetical protein [Datura stramonium]
MGVAADKGESPSGLSVYEASSLGGSLGFLAPFSSHPSVWNALTFFFDPKKSKMMLEPDSEFNLGRDTKLE